MQKAIWIIAICEIVRMIQNFVPVVAHFQDRKRMDNVYEAFIDSLKQSDREWVKHMLEEYDKQEEQ